MICTTQFAHTTLLSWKYHHATRRVVLHMPDNPLGALEYSLQNEVMRQDESQNSSQLVSINLFSSTSSKLSLRLSLFLQPTMSTSSSDYILPFLPLFNCLVNTYILVWLFSLSCVCLFYFLSHGKQGSHQPLVVVGVQSLSINGCWVNQIIGESCWKNKLEIEVSQGALLNVLSLI